MKDSLSNQNSFIFDRNWLKVNPNNQLTVSIEQAKLFLKLLAIDHQKLKKINDVNLEDVNEKTIEGKVQTFIFKFIQERELAIAVKRELPTLQKSPYKLDLNDCLEIWRWISEDCVSYKTKEVTYDESMIDNEFELGNNYETYQIKKNVDYSSKNKKIFSELSLEEQELVLKKSLEMVHMYYHQFKIIFNHYCKFVIENEHKRTTTFDDMTHSLEKLTINRFMLFCREFDIIKTLEFKRKTQRNSAMSKDLLLKIFKKGAHVQKYMTFDGFLMSLVHISVKLHENFDPRSYMHIELFLNNLKVKYYQEFVKKLEGLGIKYSPTQFYNCYKHIFNKHVIKKKQESRSTIFNNPYFTNHQSSSRMSNVDSQNVGLHESRDPKPKQFIRGNIMRSSQSVPNLVAQQYGIKEKILKKASKTLHKRKVSVPILPSLEQNRYFKPIQPSHHRSVYNKYLQKVEESSSVFKNRITGYANINNLKSKGFHMNDNPEAISKETFESLIVKKKSNIKPLIKQNKITQQNSLVYSEVRAIEKINQMKEAVSERGDILAAVPQFQSQIISSKSINDDLLNEPASKQHPSNTKSEIHQNLHRVEKPSFQNSNISVPAFRASKFIEKEQKKQALESLRQKIDVRDDDELLNKHLIAEQSKEREVNTRLIEVFKKYNFGSQVLNQ